MAKADLDNGWFRVAYQLADQFMIRDFSKREFAVLWLVMRLTYGWHSRNACPYDSAEFVRLTGLDESALRKTIRGLLEQRVLVGPSPDRLRRGDMIGLNPHYDTWGVITRGPDKASKKVETTREAGQNDPEEAASQPDPAGQNDPEEGHNNPEAGQNDPDDSGSEQPAERVETTRERVETTRDGDGDASSDADREASREITRDREINGDPPPHAGALTRAGGEGGQAPRETILGKTAPAIADAIHAGMRTFFAGEEELVAWTFFGHKPGSFLNLPPDRGRRLAAYLAHPTEKRQAAWAYADANTSINNPFGFVEKALATPEAYPQVWGGSSRPTTAKARPLPTATPRAPLSDDEKRRQYTL